MRSWSAPIFFMTQLYTIGIISDKRTVLRNSEILRCIKGYIIHKAKKYNRIRLSFSSNSKYERSIISYLTQNIYSSSGIVSIEIVLPSQQKSKDTNIQNEFSNKPDYIQIKYCVHNTRIMSVQSKLLSVIDMSDEVIYDFRYVGYENICYNLSKRKQPRPLCYNINDLHDIVPINILQDSISYIRDNHYRLIASSIPKRFLHSWIADTPDSYRKYFEAMPDLLVSVRHLDDSFLPIKIFTYIYVYITDSWLLEDSYQNDADNMAYKLFVSFQRMLFDSLYNTAKKDFDIIANLRVKISDNLI